VSLEVQCWPMRVDHALASGNGQLLTANVSHNIVHIFTFFERH